MFLSVPFRSLSFPRVLPKVVVIFFYSLSVTSQRSTIQLVAAAAGHLQERSYRFFPPLTITIRRLAKVQVAGVPLSPVDIIAFGLVVLVAEVVE